MTTWCSRREPLEPRAAAGMGAVAQAIAAVLLARDDAALGTLRGVAGGGVIVLLGAADHLPWVDGVSYLGVDPEAPSLLLPTTMTPRLPLALFERAVLRRASSGGPFAILTEERRLVSTAGARAVVRSELERFARPP